MCIRFALYFMRTYIHKGYYGELTQRHHHGISPLRLRNGGPRSAGIGSTQREGEGVLAIQPEDGGHPREHVLGKEQNGEAF